MHYKNTRRSGLCIIQSSNRKLVPALRLFLRHECGGFARITLANFVVLSLAETDEQKVMELMERGRKEKREDR
jgi:hypothetical protein